MLKATHPFDFFGISDIGLIRDHNEDVWAAYPELGLFLLADGMGGHAAGEVAAKEAVNRLFELIKDAPSASQRTMQEAIELVEQALKETNSSIYQKASSDEALFGMGTTICAIYFLSPQKVILGHVGDSRIYRLRSGRLTQMTEDHSLISEMVAMGVMDPKEGKSFPYKHILTRAIGSHPTVEPTVLSADVLPKDLYLLCSDGLTNFVKDDEIKDVLMKRDSLEKKAHQLISLANEQGGGDNITCILVRI